MSQSQLAKVGIVAVLAFVLAGCAPGASTQQETITDAVGADKTAIAKQAALDFVEEKGFDKVELDELKVGFLQLASAGASSKRLQSEFETGAALLGWEVVVCDAQGDPIEMARCGDVLLNQDIDALFSLSVEPSVINAQLIRAQEMGVPVFNLGGGVEESPLLAGNYFAVPEDGGTVMGDYIVEMLDEAKIPEAERTQFVLQYSAKWAKSRESSTNAVTEPAGLVTVGTASIDAKNIVDGSNAQVNAALTKDPNLKVLLITWDAAAPGAGQAVRQYFPGEQFPDRPLLVSFNAEQGALALLAEGTIDALAGSAFEANSWQALDQAAEYFARDITPAKTMQDKNVYPLEFLEFVLITDIDQAVEGGGVVPGNDYLTFFKTKWAAEFGK